MTRGDGTPVGAVFGFCSMLWKLLQEQKCDHIAVIFDAGRRSFRNDIYPEYKAHRPEPPPELVPQFGLVRDATRAFNIPAIEVPGLEADDLIATYARRGVEAGATVTIISSDKDLMQLIRPGIEMFDPLKSKPIGEAEVREKFGVGPDKVVDVQSLAGDSTDNVPGVPGIGVKTAAELIATYGDLDTLLARAGEIKQPKRREALLANAEKARISRELVRLRDDCELPAPIDSFAKRRPDPAVLRSFLEAQAFRSLLARFQADGSIVAEGGGATSGDATPAGPAPAAGAPRSRTVLPATC